MAKTDPLEPGHIPGQNPNTPERLQGEMMVGVGRVSNTKARVVSLIAIPLAVAVALFVIYSTMMVDPGTRPEGDPKQQTRGQ
jgi:hypothetical protein